MVIKSIGALSVAKLTGILYAAFGLIIGLVVSLVSLAGGFAAGSDSGMMGFGVLFGVGAIVLLPILYGCMGFVVSLVGAWLYNLAAGAVGGIELTVQ
jgi:hypothetical protein